MLFMSARFLLEDLLNNLLGVIQCLIAELDSFGFGCSRGSRSIPLQLSKSDVRIRAWLYVAYIDAHAEVFPKV